MFDALDIVRAAAKPTNSTEAECALRRMMHHSQLRKDRGDAVIIGVSSTTGLEERLQDFEKWPLPDEIRKALDKAWEMTKGVS